MPGGRFQQKFGVSCYADPAAAPRLTAPPDGASPQSPSQKHIAHSLQNDGTRPRRGGIRHRHNESVADFGRWRPPTKERPGESQFTSQNSCTKITRTDDAAEALIALERLRSVHQAVLGAPEVGRIGQFLIPRHHRKPTTTLVPTVVVVPRQQPTHAVIPLDAIQPSA